MLSSLWLLSDISTRLLFGWPIWGFIQGPAFSWIANWWHSSYRSANKSVSFSTWSTDDSTNNGKIVTIMIIKIMIIIHIQDNVIHYNLIRRKRTKTLKMKEVTYQWLLAGYSPNDRCGSGSVRDNIVRITKTVRVWTTRRLPRTRAPRKKKLVKKKQ